jgi:parvulin-like peptidyl-prolyl isomerase
MEMRVARMMGMCGLVVAALGCAKVSKDSSRVLANVGGEKITEKAFGEAVRILVGDDAKANEMLTNPAMKEQRNQFLAELIDQKTMTQYGDKQGLDKDPKARLLAEAARSNAYGQILMERTLSKAEPTDAELKAFYDEVAARAKMAGQDQGFPPFEAVKAQLPAAYKRSQIQKASQRLLETAKAQVVTTVDPEWRAAGM